MLKQERAAFISKRLNEIYPETPVPLNHEDAYQLLVAVLLSAQCTDARVNIVTPGLFAKASNAQDMAVLEEDEILEAIKSCGLAPKKSRAIKRLSEILVENYNGEVPNDYASLEALPGVGHKTASVVMSQWFGFPAFAVDTHIHRLAQRWGLTNGKNVQKTEADLKKLFDKSLWNKLNLQIIFWGREFCQAKACFGLECDICKTCFPKRIKPFAHKKP